MYKNIQIIAEVKTQSPFGFKSEKSWDELFAVANEEGIHATDAEIKKAIDAGADYILVVGRIPSVYHDKCLIEPLTLDEVKTIPQNLKIVWNSRELKDGSIKKETFEDARKIFKGWMCQASNITSVKNINNSADAVLVGTNLIDFAKSLKN